MAMRTCIKCGEEKPLTAEYFYRSKVRRCGLVTRCKVCKNKDMQKYYEENPEKFRARQKKYREANREKLLVGQKKYREANREKIRAHTNKWRKENPDYERSRRRNDPTFRLHRNLRSGLWQCLTGKRKKSHTLEYVGMDKPELWEYLESKFTDGMARENYGEWHVDHIRPLCSFDFDQFKEGSEEYENLLHQAWHYTNLQPLWAKDNLSKHGKWEGALCQQL